MKNILLICCAVFGLSPLFASDTTRVDELLLLGGPDMDVRVHSNSNGVLVQWLTGDTTNLDSYEVQRATEFGDWSTVYRLPARRALVYLDEQFVDPQPNIGVNAYRVVAKYRDGSVMESSPHVLSYLGAHDIKIFPNPVVSGQPLYIQFIGPALGDFHVELIDERGKRLDYQSFSGTGEHEQVSFIPNAVRTGSHVVRLYYNEIPIETWSVQIQ